MNQETRIPPSAPEVERAVLAASLDSMQHFSRISEKITAEEFYTTDFKALFSSFSVLAEKGTPIDSLAVLDEISRTGEPNTDKFAVQLSELMEIAWSPGSIDEYCRILLDKSARRKIIIDSQRMFERAYDEESTLEALTDNAYLLHNNLADHCDKAGIARKRFGKVVRIKDIQHKIRDFFTKGDQVQGLNPGWPTFRKHYRPAPGTLNIVTGMPGSGKSEFVDALMVNLSELHGIKWGIFSPENYPYEVHVQKIVEKRVKKAFFRDMSFKEMCDATDWVHEHMRWAEPDEYNITQDALFKLADEMVEKDGITGMVIDPWNEMDVTTAQGETETNWIARYLAKWRRWSRKNKVITYIVAHPAKMQKEKRGKEWVWPVPTLYNISGSAHWYNKADNGITIHRERGSKIVEVHIQKIKFKIHGNVGVVPFNYIYKSGLYVEHQEFQEEAKHESHHWSDN